MAENIKKFNNKIHVHLINDKEKSLVFNKGPRFLRYFKNANIPFFYKLESIDLIHTLNKSEIFLFHDRPYLSKYILSKYNEISIIEDGLMNYDFRRLGRLSKLKNVLFKDYQVIGQSQKIKKIYCKKVKLLHPFVRYKGIQYDPVSEYRILAPEVKYNLYSTFQIEIDKLVPLFTSKGKNILIITQPLSEDGIMSEDEKIKLFADIVSNKDNNKIFIKPHPREITDYSKKFANIILLPKLFPLELLLNNNEIKIDKAFTYYSSSIVNSENIKETTILNEYYKKKIDSLKKSIK
ncbi:MAG: hypothetical protein JXB49_08460 [Bacteroidales bacterium]|nr:hypothetical protein [Bacteroidales bacterium]